jgi:hypothetical protein
MSGRRPSRDVPSGRGLSEQGIQRRRAAGLGVAPRAPL